MSRPKGSHRVQLKLNVLPMTEASIVDAAKHMRVPKQVVIDLLVASCMKDLLSKPLFGTRSGARFWRRKLERMSDEEYPIVDFTE